MPLPGAGPVTAPRRLAPTQPGAGAEGPASPGPHAAQAAWVAAWGAPPGGDPPEADPRSRSRPPNPRRVRICARLPDPSSNSPSPLSLTRSRPRHRPGRQSRVGPDRARRHGRSTRLRAGAGLHRPHLRGRRDAAPWRAHGAAPPPAPDRDLLARLPPSGAHALRAGWRGHGLGDARRGVDHRRGLRRAAHPAAVARQRAQRPRRAACPPQPGSAALAAKPRSSDDQSQTAPRRESTA